MIEKLSGYRLATMLATGAWKLASAVATPFMIGGHKLNGGKMATVAKTPAVATPVATRKPAQIGHFQAIWLLATSLATQKKNREKRWAAEGIAREASPCSHSSQNSAPNPRNHHHG